MKTSKTTTTALTTQSRILGGLYGSLVGDALGVPVEFHPRSERVLDPVTDMRDYGTHGQPKGTWSDDGSLLLCSAESLALKGFDTQDMGDRFVRWWNRGHWGAHGKVFDIGNATRKALTLVEHGCPAELAGGKDQYDNGNGSLMRILPVALASMDCGIVEFMDRHQRASAITHGHPRSMMACAFHGLIVRELMLGKSPQQALLQARGPFKAAYAQASELANFGHLLQSDFASWHEAEIGSGGYVLDTLTASLWCLLTTRSFAECVLKAVNLGDDTDTTGCVAGGIAGVLYGVESIPTEWLAALPRAAELRELFDSFLKTTQPPAYPSP